MTRRIGRGGRKGETHTATPGLRSYDVPPASPVTATRADGTQVVKAAKQAKLTARPARQSRKTGPLICAWCGGPIKGAKDKSQDGQSRGKPVHLAGECDTTPAKRPSNPDPASTLPRSQGGAGAPYKSANAQAVTRQEWLRVPCPKCKARPGTRCAGTTGAGGGPSTRPHQERVQVVRRSREQQRLKGDAVKRERPRPSGRQPRMKDMYRIECPTCRAAPGADCTIRGGHSIRYNRMMDLFRSGEFKLA